MKGKEEEGGARDQAGALICHVMMIPFSETAALIPPTRQMMPRGTLLETFDPVVVTMGTTAPTTVQE